MAVDEDKPDISYRREGNLFLVDERGGEAARPALNLQKSLGCPVEWWSPAMIEDNHGQEIDAGPAKNNDRGGGDVDQANVAAGLLELALDVGVVLRRLTGPRGRHRVGRRRQRSGGHAEGLEGRG